MHTFGPSVKLGVSDDFTADDVEEHDGRWVVIVKGDGTSTMFASNYVVRINIYDELVYPEPAVA